jgi:malate dehydrogenase (oxaloacetate-decarboxylating)
MLSRYTSRVIKKRVATPAAHMDEPLAEGMKMDIAEKALELHEQWQGKLNTVPKMEIKTREDLALAYTPGVAEPCKKIAEDESLAYVYTQKANTVAVVSDGSAVLGLGNIGPAAAMPVMEGKCALFKAFGGVNAVPLCLDTQDVDEIVETVKRLAPSFGGINLEDISAPRCFEIERRLIDELDIPVFHDDQHGTAIVVLSGVINALRLTGKKKEDCRVVVNGAGSAGIAIAKLLLNYGFRNLILCDKCGIICSASEGINDAQRAMLATTNLNDEQGSLADAMRGADIFIGVSAPGIVSADMVKSMNDDAILFAMANPTPEIFPDVAREAGARVVGTGRSDFPNQINNVVAFPGIFKGALEARATRITKQMKLAAAEALAALVSDDQLCEDFIMPEAFDPRAVEVVAKAVADAVQG